MMDVVVRAEMVFDDGMYPHVAECFKHHDLYSGWWCSGKSYWACAGGSELGKIHCHCTTQQVASSDEGNKWAAPGEGHGSDTSKYVFHFAIMFSVDWNESEPRTANDTYGCDLAPWSSTGDVLCQKFDPARSNGDSSNLTELEKVSPEGPSVLVLESSILVGTLSAAMCGNYDGCGKPVWYRSDHPFMLIGESHHMPCCGFAPPAASDGREDKFDSDTCHHGSLIVDVHCEQQVQRSRGAAVGEEPWLVFHCTASTYTLFNKGCGRYGESETEWSPSLTSDGSGTDSTSRGYHYCH